jgi:hypothetical protein
MVQSGLAADHHGRRLAMTHAAASRPAWPALLVAMLAGTLVLALFWAGRTLTSREDRLSDPAGSPP